MTISDYWNSQLPDYYPTMHLDGYTPQQIIQALRNTERKKYEAQREQERLEKEALKMVEQNFKKVVNQAMADIFKSWNK